MKEILLNQKQVDALIQHSEKAGLSESCAMLLGTHNDQQWNVKEVFLTRNAHADSKTSFIITSRRTVTRTSTCREKTVRTCWDISFAPRLSCGPIKL